MVYQTLSSLFILSNRIKKLKKTLKNKEEWKNISEIFINQCNELLLIEEKNDDQKFMTASFIFSNDDIIECSLKYCSKNLKENFEANKMNFFKTLNLQIK